MRAEQAETNPNRRGNPSPAMSSDCVGACVFPFYCRFHCHLETRVQRAKLQTTKHTSRAAHTQGLQSPSRQKRRKSGAHAGWPCATQNPMLPHVSRPRAPAAQLRRGLITAVQSPGSHLTSHKCEAVLGRGEILLTQTGAREQSIQPSQALQTGKELTGNPEQAHS